MPCRYGSPDPATSMGNMLCHSPAWTRSSEDLIDILRCRYEDITLPMLGAAFFERGWLAPNVLGIHPIDTLTLGDIGYVNETGNFVVIDNLRHSIQARSGPLFWSEYLQVQSRPEDIVNTPSEEILSSTGKSYQRRRQQSTFTCFIYTQAKCFNLSLILDSALSLSPRMRICASVSNMKIWMKDMRGKCSSSMLMRSSPVKASL